MYIAYVGRMGVGAFRTLEAAVREAKEAAEEEAGLQGMTFWRVVREEDGTVVADGIENA